MAVSVIISNFNGACWLPRLLASIETQQGVGLEVIVVDRHSSDESAHILAAHPKIKVIKEPPESGLVAGYHAGTRVAQCDHLFFCNEDMWFAPDCLRRLEREIDVPRRVACADPSQWSYDGSKLIHSGAQIHTQWNRGSPHPWHPFQENESLTCGSVIACASAGAMMIHRVAYDQAGGWDRSFFLDQEDTDLAIRLWQRGWFTVTVPEAKVFHAVGGSNTKILSKRREPVAKRRYVYALANQFIVVWKLFSPRLWFLPFLSWLEIAVKDIIKLRFRRAVWDFLALKTSLTRLPCALRFRRANKTFAKLRPGELFYQDPNLQFGACVEPQLETSETRSENSAVQLSIAVVTRNRPQWLRQALESWRSQETQPFEIIISDDSDDSIRAQIKSIADEFNCRWIAGPRRGLYANRNRAFRACRGTHVMSADDDHTHPQGFVRKVIEEIRSDPGAVWTVSERPADQQDFVLPVPGELRSNGTVGPPEDPTRSAAIACGSTIYPRKIFQLGFCCVESYRFGNLWYLWGHRLRRAGFRIRHTAKTFVWHHASSSIDRRDDRKWLEAQHECNLYVQAAHAFWISKKPVAFFRALNRALQLLTFGDTVGGHERKVRLRTRFVLRAFGRALRPL